MRFLFDFLIFILVILIPHYDGHLINAETVTIPTKLGPVKGVVLSSDHGQKFTAFRGIRYGKSERFEEPKLFGKRWTEVYDATNDGPMCLQINEAAFIANVSLAIGQEDCLFLNVYRPQKSTFEKFPVMVFLHGGGYMSGSGHSAIYGPQRLMDKDITLVTINYRLGPFGFLSTSDEFAQGNYGFSDQVTALRWVHEYISDFGGDNQRVTIFGVSAGSSSASLHLLSTRSKGLFHGAILQSGNVLSDWGFEYRSPINITLKLATALQCPTTNTLSAIECLRQKPAADIMTIYSPLPGASDQREPNFIFRPTMDKFGLITSHPAHLRQLLHNGHINVVPVISGVTRDEGIMFYLMAIMIARGMETSSSGLDELLSTTNPALMSNPERAKRAVRMIQSLYLNGVDEKNVTQRVIVMNKVFGADIDTSTDNLNELLTKRGLPVYPYRFTHRGQASIIDLFAKLFPAFFASGVKMISHGDDMQYLFKSSYFGNADLSDNDQKMADELITLWTNFAKNKIPSLDKSDSDKENRSGFRWDTLNVDQPKYLDLNLRPRMVDGYLSEDRALWNSIYQYHYFNPQPDKCSCCHKTSH